MTITVYEFRAVDASGNPIQPAAKITRAAALDAAFSCLKTTRLARVVSTTDVRICVGGTPTAGDELLRADTAKDFQLPKSQGSATTIMVTSGSLNPTSASDVTIGLAAGAANVMTISIQAVDASGASVAAVHELDLHFSTSAVGAVVTATAYSGTLVAVTGAIAVTVTAAKVFRILTDATGAFVGSLTATGKPATEYVCVKKPGAASLKVSVVSGVLWG